MNEFIVFGIIVAILLWYGLQNKYNITSYNRAPKKIWSFMTAQPNGLIKPTKVEQQCIKSWKKWNPEYEIVVLTKKTLHSYVTIPDEIREHPIFTDRFIDLVRLWTLAEHGGVWLDSNVLVKAPLDKWMFPKYGEFSGFYEDPDTKIITWFMATNKKCDMVRAWADAFSELARYPHLDYFKSNADPVQIAFKEVFFRFRKDLFILQRAQELISQVSL